MDIIFIQAIQELELPPLPVDGLRLDDSCCLCPVGDEVRMLLDHILLPFIGAVHHETLRNAPAVNYVKQLSSAPITQDEADRTLLGLMTWSQLFLLSTWLVKDNSGNTGDGHLLLAEVGPGVKGVHSQRPGVLNFTADCHRVSTTLCQEEFDAAVAHFNQLKGIIPFREWKFDEPRPSGLIFDSRLVRTIYFAQAARASAEIALKLAFQCLCFESLCASSADSISHRVCERAALLLGPGGKGSRAVYATVRELYKQRSVVVHGDPIKQKKIPELRELAKRADDCLRRTLWRILASEELLKLFSTNNATAIDEYFLGRIFPDPAPDRVQ